MSQLRAAILPVTPLEQNCTLFWDADTKAALVVDPGGDAPEILSVIEKEGLRVERILLTHGHFDHAGGAAVLRDALGVPLDGPDERDAFLLDRVAEDAARFGLSGLRPARPDRWLAEGDEIVLGEHRFAVLHCPGHTPGHVVFVNHEAGIAQLGDVLFRGSVGRTDFPYCDPEALLLAIRDKVMALPDTMRFICGHGPGSTVGTERRENPFVREALAMR